MPLCSTAITLEHLRSLDLTALPVLGFGNHAVVYRVPLGPYALKIERWRDCPVLPAIACSAVVQIYAVYRVGGERWSLLELMAGGTLADRPGSREEAFLVRVAEGVLRALAHLNDLHGILHADLKPQNILFQGRGDDGTCKGVKLGDLGLSFPLDNGPSGCGGTLFYMAPERMLGKPSLVSDIWSLGMVLLLHALSGSQSPLDDILDHHREDWSEFDFVQWLIEDTEPVHVASLLPPNAYSPPFVSLLGAW